MNGYNPSVATKLIFAFSILIIIFPLYGLFEKRGYQAAGVVCSALVSSTALLIFIYFSYLDRGWLRGVISAILLLDVLLTVASMKIDFKLSSTWVIPIALFYVIAFGAVIEIIGRRFEGHSL